MSSTPTAAAVASSSSTQNRRRDKYEVFISFSGADIRDSFLSFLVPALKSKSIKVFMDDKLKAEDITESLFRMIEQTDMSIVIFSKSYPDSKWCMEELEKIHESMVLRGHRALPVFYKIDPSHVQNLEQQFAVENPKWRVALEKISNLAGCDSKNQRTEAALIDEIVGKVYDTLLEICPISFDDEGLFGVDSSIKEVEELLHIDSANDVRMVGIWGMGGIGKTTIASLVLDRNKNKFDGNCFISVKGMLSTRAGQITARDKIIRDLLGENDLKIDSSDRVDGEIRRRLKLTKALLVLDDVLTRMQLASLLEKCSLSSPKSFCQGSRIIVTTRDSEVPLQDGRWKSDIYAVNQLEDKEALQLFCWHAFGQDNPLPEYKDLPEKAIRYANGLPLALRVLGRELGTQETSYWERKFEKFGTTGPVEVQEILRISFDDWLEKDEKIIFLDIACFLNGFTTEYVENMLQAFGFHARLGIDRLINKTLLKKQKEDQREIITMHDLVEQMGREVVAEERKSKGYQSRLWTFEDIKDALTNRNKRIWTKNVEAISLRNYYGGKIEIDPEAFKEMGELRLLKLKSYNNEAIVDCSQDLQFLPQSIKYLDWDNFSKHHWPSDYNSQNLVELHLKRSQLEKIIWTKHHESLKHISLRESPNLQEISGWEKTPNLEVIDLGNCNNLDQVGSSLIPLKKLKKINLDGWKSSNLVELPCSIEEMELRWSELQELPWTMAGLAQLKRLSLSFCEELKILPPSISSLISLEVMDLFNCSILEKFESSLENLVKLTRLDVSKCTSLSTLPDLPSSILEFRASESGLKQLPTTIGCLIHLKDLSLGSCVELETLPSSFCDLTSLEKLDLSSCIRLKKLPDDCGRLESLKVLDASYSGLTELPPSLENLSKLIKLDLRACKRLQSLPVLPSNLEEFYARHCPLLADEVKLSIVEQYLRKVEEQPTKIRKFCVDGQQVPELMTYRNDSGTSIVLGLKTVGDAVTLIFCVVVAQNSFLRQDISSSDPVAILSDGDSQIYKYAAYPNGGPQVLHDYLEDPPYFILWNCTVDRKSLKEVSFELMTVYDGEQIFKCGCHPILYSAETNSEDLPAPPVETSTFDIDAGSRENVSKRS